MTVEVGIFEAKTHLSELVDQVASGGEDVLITKRGRPVARLVPVPSGDSGVENALRLLLAAREASSPGPDSLRDLIDSGRRR
jgi:prevent-host-death family protein